EGLTLKGEDGDDEVVLKQTGNKNKLIDVYDASNITIEGLTLDGSENDEDSTGVDANSVEGLTLRNLIVNGFKKNGIAVTAQYDGDSLVSRDITIDSVTVDDAGWAGIAFYTRSSKGIEAD